MNNETVTTGSYTKRPVWQWIVIYALVAVVVYGGVYYVFMRRNTNAYQANSNSVTNSGVVLAQKQLFKDNQMYASAYQIFPGLISAQAKQAMVGFTTQTQSQADGSVQVTMTAANPEYKNQQYTVQPGYTLFFIEKNPGDDSASENTDRSLADDTAVLVDPRGYLVNQ